jgi:hypothetical protein
MHPSIAGLGDESSNKADICEMAGILSWLAGGTGLYYKVGTRVLKAIFAVGGIPALGCL